MQVEEVSIDVIKPSTPTPSHLRTHKFSLIDQHFPNAHLSVPLFYSSPTNANPSQILTHLKTSLSKTLTLFYPLAGRVKDHSHIDCNDEGVKFVHAQVRHCTLSQALTPPDERLNQLFPKLHTTGEQLLGIQVSFFECGGFAIGVYLSHKIVDARSFCTFVLGWASIAKIGVGEDQDRPRFDSASVFPPIDLPESSSDHTDFEATERVVFRVFRFEASKIEALKAIAKGSAVDRPPSKMMAVTALLWTLFAAMDGEKQNQGPRPCQLAVAVSLRGRLRTDPEAPNFRENTVGNSAVIPVTPPMAPPRDLTGLPDLVKALKDLVGRIDESDLARRRDGAEILKSMDSYAEAAGKASASGGGECGFYEVASWLRLPFYEADFGWGKPVWFGYLPGAFKNIISYLDTKCGEGVEAWVWMTEEDMARFESMPELLEFSTPVRNALDQ